jgi:hypothetical protein
MYVISNNNSLSVESNLDINNIYNPVNNDFSITDFRENNTFNFEIILLSSESQGRRQGKSCGRGCLQTRKLKEINKPKLILTQTLYTPIIYIWEGFEDLIRLCIRNIVEITLHS